MSQPERICGGCTACCKTHHVFELNKPAGRWCQYCTKGHGCSVYIERPRGCRDFACQWLKGHGDENSRPDRSKIVVDYCDIGLPEQVASLWEVTEGAMERRFAKDTTNDMLANNMFTSRVYLSGRSELIVPPGGKISDEMIRALREAGYEVLYAVEAHQ